MIYHIIEILSVLAVAYFIKKLIKKQKEIDRIMEERYTRECSNCEYRERFKTPFDYDKIYCKDGTLKYRSCHCEYHRFDEETRGKAEFRYYLNKIRGNK